MGGQILGGGAIALVVALLWLAYLLPSWQASVRYNAAEKNAVRLNQALRVLAHTSEAPEELRVELSRREAAKQQRLVRRLQAEEDRIREENDRAQVEAKKRELEAERMRRAIAVEDERRRLAELRADPRVRQARARRQLRLAATTLSALGLAAAGVGAWLFATTGQALVAGIGLAALVAGLVTLRRMAGVARRARAHVAAAVARPRRRTVSELIDPEDRGWTPRRLPAPLTATAGSRASDEVIARAAREEARRSAEQAAARKRIAERDRPAPIRAVEADRFVGVGVVDDAEIEQHVRELLARRAVG
ncbi:large exoprotein [Microbacterium excoecariae]|uniref:large exoprotein n=1 Tax=Microbacterium excoecariae TaxID=2715210 RepID=UPI00140A7266|nr:large exoprotein [Microbacterium excoecariae]NHI17903.1 large exoprotein [Microbacterium excoecariae]